MLRDLGTFILLVLALVIGGALSWVVQQPEFNIEATCRGKKAIQLDSYSSETHGMYACGIFEDMHIITYNQSVVMFCLCPGDDLKTIFPERERRDQYHYDVPSDDVY